MKIQRIIFVGAAMVLMGCAHGLMRGSVAMKVSDSEAHVCLGDQDVKVGEKVVAYKNQCTKGVGRGDASGFCKKLKLGEGTVSKLLNEHYSLVQFETGVAFDEGTIVEVKK